MRVVFMGTPEFAVPTLNALYECHEVVAVVSQPDKPKGRGKKIVPTPVKARALQLGLDVYQPARVRDESFLDLMRALAPDVIVVAAYARLIPQVLLDLPKYGCLNLHPSKLPRFRGAIPVQACLMSGAAVTGVTTFVMNAGYDTGDLLLSREVAIKPGEVGSELLERLAGIGAELMLETLNGLLLGTLMPQPQVGEAEYSKPLKKEDLLIDWSWDASRVVNFVRALADLPAAGTMWAGEPFKVGRASVATSEAAEDLKPGTLVSLIKGRGPLVKCGAGCVVLERVKPAGKGWMEGGAFAAGRRWEPDFILGEVKQ